MGLFSMCVWLCVLIYLHHSFTLTFIPKCGTTSPVTNQITNYIWRPTKKGNLKKKNMTDTEKAMMIFTKSYH